MSLLTRVRDLLIPPLPEAAAPTAGDSRSRRSLSNQEVSDWIVGEFKRYIDSQSTRMTLLFPADITVLMDEADYAACGDALPLLSNEIFDRLARTVGELLPSYPDYRLHARNWLLTVVPVGDDDLLPDEFGDIRPAPGCPAAVMQLYPKEQVPEGRLQGRVVGTVRGVGTLNAMPAGFNVRALGAVDQLARGRYTAPIVLPGLQSAPSLRPEPELPGIAGLTLAAQLGQLVDINGQKVRRLTVHRDCDTVEIHGRDTVARSGGRVAVIRVDCQEMLNPHATLHRRSDGRWICTLHGPATVNEVALDRDRGADVPLPNHSTLLIAQSIQLQLIL